MRGHLSGRLSTLGLCCGPRLLLAGLRSLPQQPFEAAALDGVPRLFVFFRITLPMLSPYIITASLFRLLDAIQQFDIVYAMTQGGPGNSTTVLSYQVYQLAFTGLYYGYGSALAVFAFIVVATLSLIFFLFMRRSEQAL